MHLVFEHKDGTASAVAVNGMSEVRVQTWTPPVFGDGGTSPRLVEDQTVALNDVTRVYLADDAGAGVQVLAAAVPLEEISEQEAERLDRQFESAPAITDKPWDEAA